MANPIRPLSSFNVDSGRQSPFRRQNSSSPATICATTPTASPTKASPTKNGSLSPEKSSPFVRRPSQINHTGERPSSPFARPSSSLNVPASPSRQASYTSQSEKDASESPRPTVTRRNTPPSPRQSPERKQDIPAPSSPSPFDGAGSDSPSTFQLPTLRPTTHRTVTSSTTSTIRAAAPIFNTAAAPKLQPSPVSLPKTFAPSNSAYKNVPPPLLRSLHESFSVLDTSATNTLTPSTLTPTLDQLGLSSDPSSLRQYFPSSQIQTMNLARYLETLTTPFSALSPPEELVAAFEAFDVDDSGQIDIGELRRALLHTAPEVGEDSLSEREVDGVLGEFAGRRAFGAKGVNVAKGKGDVFRYREFMGALVGGEDGGMGGEGGVVA